MKSSLDIASVGRRGDRFILLNASDTNIVVRRKLKIDIPLILSEMEELGVPISYTKGLESIQLTVFPRNAGDYLNNVIRLSCNRDSMHLLGRVLVHELGHHVDSIENISGDGLIVSEKRQYARYMPDNYARKSESEYVAVGFEVFYYGTPQQKQKMKDRNRYLYNTIRSIHRSYGKR